MVLTRNVFCGVQFKPSILSELIFAGEGVGTFVKDGFIFHRFKVTHVDRSTNAICGRWIGMTPSNSYVENWKPSMLFTFPTMRVLDIDVSQNKLVYYSMACTSIVQAPDTIKAEDEILIHQKTNPYVQIR